MQNAINAFRSRVFLQTCFSFFSPFIVRRESPNGSQRRFSRYVMKKNDDAEDGVSRAASRRATGLAESGSNRGQFVDVIDENASRVGGASESVEWLNGRPVVIFNFSIKAQVGRLMVAICSSGCVSTVDLTSYADAQISRQKTDSSLAPRRFWSRGRHRIPLGAVGRLDFGTNIKIGRRTLR